MGTDSFEIWIWIDQQDISSCTCEIYYVQSIPSLGETQFSDLIRSKSVRLANIPHTITLTITTEFVNRFHVANHVYGSISKC